MHGYTLAVAKRRMPGEGSVFQRKDGTWLASLSIGGRTNRHFRRRTARSAGQPNTRAGAVEALKQLNDEVRRGVRVSRQSLGDYLRSWLDETASPAISANTYRGYSAVLNHLEPIAGIRLGDLTAEDIERCCNRMTAKRGKSKVPASAKTVRNAQAMLRSALQNAVDRGHLLRNEARLVKLRKVPRYQVEALTGERAREILAAVAGDRYEASYALALGGALRASEVLGLAWNDVDLERATVAIRYQLVGSGPRAARGDTKTAGSMATIRIPPFVVARLEALREQQKDERPVASLDGGLVFVTPKGYAVNGSWWTKHFQKLLANAGLPHMRPHDLRHGTATLLVDAGVHPRIVQEALRHAPGSKQTMARYSHVSAARASEAIDVLEKVIAGGPGL